ncbi:glycosyltransferase [Lacinutrix neustonica]|uniref:Glycosyltransferase n=1 Tax=Lacinutrix neustonica TaxID=2980107 RepID=A0A9E8MWG9_9FLAO|nr:glycosyltransferase [Lacinutrix neustonica]WAC01872.1 glycosyltransferase [Lacinutrix neustonica]
MKPLLSICCTTYNHVKFVKQTLDGFLLQETNFPIEIIIHDDASTDGTQDLLKVYAEKDSRVKLILQQENQYSQNIKPWAHFCFPKAQGKYIALCEGDDYWVDPLKLQKQVDFLEANPEYTVSWTNFEILKREGLSKNDFTYTTDIVTIDFNNLFTPYSTYTLTAVFKKQALNIELYKTLKHSKDNSLYVMLLQKGKGVFMNFISAVYRIHEGGAYSLQSDFFKHYSSYLNLQEVTTIVAESRTKNINKILKSLANGAAFSSLKSKHSGEKMDQVQVRFMTNHFNQASFKTKFKYYKRLFKYKFLK